MKEQKEKVKKHEIEMDQMKANIEQVCKNREVDWVVKETKRKDIMEIYGEEEYFNEEKTSSKTVVERVQGDLRYWLENRGLFYENLNLKHYSEKIQIGGGIQNRVFLTKKLDVEEEMEMVILKGLLLGEEKIKSAVREVMITCDLRHPNVIGVMRVFFEKEATGQTFVYMEMPYLEMDLLNYSRGEEREISSFEKSREQMARLYQTVCKLSLNEVKYVFREILNGMLYLHKRDSIEI